MVSAEEFLNLVSQTTDYALLDVRSEGEFAKGHLPDSQNIPILNNQHRHEVGLTYKQKGQKEAIDLGHKLVDPIKDTIINSWQAAFANHQTQNRFLYCWRGGLRSQISQEWLQNHDVECRRIEGGYKKVRNLLLRTIEEFNKPLWILSGLTGSGKSKLIRKLPVRAVLDLEKHANHRGSAFGGYVDRPQPTQQDFENTLGLNLWAVQTPIVVEDESRTIGRCVIPEVFNSQMAKAPLVLLKETLEQRAENIYQEYIRDEIQRGLSWEQIKNQYLDSLDKIKSRLGGFLYSEIQIKMRMAFNEPENKELHLLWISSLLVDYYDKLYAHSFARKGRAVSFEGHAEECLHFLLEQIRV